MAFVLPPPKSKKETGQQAVFKQYINAHGNLKPYAQALYRDALDYGVDPVYFASLINLESGGNPKAVSKAGAVGLGQIMPLHVGESVPWAPGTRITPDDLKNPAFNLRYSAYYFSQGLAQTGDYASAYTQHYNPGYTGTPFGDVPKTYVPTTTAKSPTESAQSSVETSAAKAALTATWAVVGKRGALKFVTRPTPPKGTLKVFGQPVDKSSFLQMYAGIQDDYLAYTGKRPSFGQAAVSIAHGESQYQLRQRLAQTPGFVNSPVWRQNAPGYEDVYKTIYGPNAKVDTKAMRYAIANNLGSTGFAQYLRDQPTYEQSNEFKQSFASSANVFRGIYGELQPGDEETVKMAVKNGYDSNQFAQYLRAQPQWKSSAEAQQLWYGLANRMGLIPGKEQTVLQNG